MPQDFLKFKVLYVLSITSVIRKKFNIRVKFICLALPFVAMGITSIYKKVLIKNYFLYMIQSS